MPTVASSYEAFLHAVFVLVAVQDLVLSEVETLAVLGAGGFGKVTLVRYKGERRHCLQGCLRVWVPNCHNLLRAVRICKPVGEASASLR